MADIKIYKLKDLAMHKKKEGYTNIEIWVKELVDACGWDVKDLTEMASTGDMKCLALRK